jgi:hypothetical protein
MEAIAGERVDALSSASVSETVSAGTDRVRKNFSELSRILLQYQRDTVFLFLLNR